jgi:hypothetical protein
VRHRCDRLQRKRAVSRVKPACEGMSVFIKLVAVQTGGEIDVVTAGVLRDRAGRISAVLGCQRIEAELER